MKKIENFLEMLDKQKIYLESKIPYILTLGGDALDFYIYIMIELNSKFTIEEMQKAKRMRDNFRILRKKELSAILNRGDISKLPNDEQVLIKKLRENVAEEKYFEESEGAEYAEYQENLKKVRAGEKFAQELKERGIENGDELVWGVAFRELDSYRTHRYNNIKGIDKKKDKIKKTADKLIETKKVSYEKRPEKGYIINFNDIGGHSNRFYDATQLVQPEKINGEEMTQTYIYDNSFGTEKTYNLTRLRAIRRKDEQNWKSQQMKRILEDQKKNNLGLHSRQNMEECFQALGAYYQQKNGEILDKQEQIAMWMYLTGCYGDYWLSDYGVQNGARSLLECSEDADYRGFYRRNFDDNSCGFLL